MKKKYKCRDRTVDKEACVFSSGIHAYLFVYAMQRSRFRYKLPKSIQENTEDRAKCCEREIFNENLIYSQAFMLNALLTWKANKKIAFFLAFRSLFSSLPLKQMNIKLIFSLLSVKNSVRNTRIYYNDRVHSVHWTWNA